jgi:cytochrome c oxidase subunit II
LKAREPGIYAAMPPRRHRALRRALLLACAALPLGGCGGSQSALHPESKASREIATLFWWMLGISAVVIGGALVLLLLGWLRRRTPGLPLLSVTERLTTGVVVLFGIVVPLAVNVGVFVVANFVVAQATEAPDPRTTRMTVEVTGHQWFWEVRYPGTRAVTANELHIPAGTRVNVVAKSADVIHSFWVPALNRKIDMIPGHPNRVLLESDRVGRYRGQCAEFCGLQHAHMAFYVFVDPPGRFRTWLAGEARDRTPPRSAQQRRGEQVFLNAGCASCHTIRGTSARGAIGPDLTHVGSRTTLAALTIPNTPAELARWIRDPQRVKPGNRMPALGLPDADVRALVAHLEGLR